MKIFFKIIGYLTAATFLVCMFLGGVFFAYLKDLSKGLPSVESLDDYSMSTITRIFSNEGILVKEFYSERRDVVSLEDVSEKLIDAIVSIEDSRFFEHRGVDIFGIMRAAYRNVLARGIVEGGSTITQQLAKQLFLTPEKSFYRKLKELILSLKIEKRFSKRKILELYLNKIYFGHGAYGVEAASLTFFGKNAKDLNTTESATIAAIIKAPNRYSPVRNPNQSKTRMVHVLRQMRNEGYINAHEEKEALTTNVNLLSDSDVGETGEYFVEHIRRMFLKKFGQNIFYKKGLKIHTTMDFELQKVADEVIKRHVKSLNDDYPKDADWGKEGDIQAALVAISVNDGRVLAMTGGSSFKESEFNRAIQARRQPGSSFKPIVYTAALLAGMNPSDLILDSPVILTGDTEEDEWKPENFEQKFYGSTSLRKGLAKSRNLVTIKLTEKIGISKVIRCARLLGITSHMERDLSIALGSSGLSLLELTNAFSVFPSGGKLVKPMFFEYIEDGLGNRIEENKLKQKKVLRDETAYLMTSLLQSVVTSGTGYNARVLGKPLGGKTGTTNDNRDAWFIGFSPSLVCGVWVGRDNMKPIGEKAIGSRSALPIWIDFMEKYLHKQDFEDFEIPNGIIWKKVCEKTGKLATETCEKTYNEIFIEGNEPEETCTCFLPSNKSFTQYDLEM